MNTYVSATRIEMPLYRRVAGAGMIFGGFGLGLFQAADLIFSLGLFSDWSELTLTISAVVLTAGSANCMPTIGYACIYKRFPLWVINRCSRAELEQLVRLLT